ncbi:hypothetical protein [Stappia indica]|uniref:hypothetical protein n=1 Tax=Stappia indica TaxID=538381 RepID=UPI001CD521FA|nr:hypothetical protein [Stappia indica]MCA1298024.1 hypothetical protein [Stappia indica]
MKNAVPTFWAEILIAGDVHDATRICREYCGCGLCVTVQSAEYVYTGGSQSGVIVRLINYPRFPADRETILDHANALAERLRAGLFQDSYSVMTPEETRWYSRREAAE